MRKIVEKREASFSPAVHELIVRVRGGDSPIHIRGPRGTAGRLLAAILFENTGRPVIWISPSEKEAKASIQDFSYFLSPASIIRFPAWDILTQDMFASQREGERARMGALFNLIWGDPSVIVTSLPALLQKTLPKKSFEDYIQVIAAGDSVDRDMLAAKLAEGGYFQTVLVEEHGEFSLRGNILDVFVPGTAAPYRVELIGDEVESIRIFDPYSQRSTSEAREFLLPPASELILTGERRQHGLKRIRERSTELDLPRTVRERLMERLDSGLFSFLNPLYLSLFYEKLEGLADYLPSQSILVLDDPMAISGQSESFHNELDRFFMKAEGKDFFHLEKEDAFFDNPPVFGAMQTVRLEGLVLGTGGDEADAREKIISMPVGDAGPLQTDGMQRTEEGRMAVLADKIKVWLTEGNLVHVVCGGKECRQRMEHHLSPYGMLPSFAAVPLLKEVEKRDRSGYLSFGEGKVSGSFQLDALKLVVLSDEEIFGRRMIRRRVRPAHEGFFLKSFSELKEGDFVVHTDHGIGRYMGLQKLTAGGITNDFLLVEYFDRDKLYVPVDRLDLLQRYVGPEGYMPRLDKMGGTSWASVKEKVKCSIREVAEELVAIYATREVMERKAYSPLDQLYDEFCSSFEYEETPDQYRAIEEIHLDMGGGRPMDRLICGDAGFGKTEVALRSAFRATLDGRQAAVLVPTTILAEQHYQTFSRRLATYPIRVEALNRFRNKNEQKEILEGLKSGTVDIVIGTHRLLQKDIIFRDLGLVIIDEEQRFGVQHKEKLKKLRTLVDVLTLSATPIPRTLHLSLVGIRDLSIINTPPEDRQPIRTYVLEFSEDVIRDGIRREIERGGQVFFVHDRVKSIYSMARLVEKLVPEARIGVIHGQLKASEIESSMVKFVRRECDVLVCTSIIGSGVDIPAANTIFINRADRFGLAQLYQIRGRVGRSREEAAAYLFVPKGASLSREAQKRLQAIQDFTEPGSGFRIASSDLDIRGAGSLLGLSQSGHVSAIGYELYTEMMTETIREIKGEDVQTEEIRPEIHLGLPAYLPETYMDDEHRRLGTYKRLSLAAADEEVFGIRDELIDCFGSLPLEAENLIEIIRIRNLLKQTRVQKMGYDGRQFLIAFSSQNPIDPARIVDLVNASAQGTAGRGRPGHIRKVAKAPARRGPILTPDLKLYVPAEGLQGGDILKKAVDIIRHLTTKDTMSIDVRPIF